MPPKIQVKTAELAKYSTKLWLSSILTKRLANNVVVDGELITMLERMPDFETTLRLTRTRRQRKIEMQIRKKPANYVIFDFVRKHVREGIIRRSQRISGEEGQCHN